MTRQLHEDEKNVLKLARALEPLLRSEGWHYYTQVMAARRDAHAQAVMSSTADLSGVLAGERDKGAFVALNLALGWPATVIEQAKQIRKEAGEDADAD